MEKQYYIYMTTNMINGKKYIGMHYGLPDDDYLGSGKLLNRAINKYGKENFTKKILDFSDSEEENAQKEKEYIKLFNACDDDMFYNIHEGGNGGNTTKGYTEEEKEVLRQKFSLLATGEKNGMYGKRRSQEWKDKHSYWALNIRDNSVYKTQDFRNKISNIVQGSNNGMYGRQHTEESKKKMSINSKGKTCGSKNGMYNKKDENAINGKKVSAYDVDGNLVKTFASKKMALEFLGIKSHGRFNEAIKNETLYKGYY